MSLLLSPVPGGGVSMAPIMAHIKESLEAAQAAIEEAVAPKRKPRASRKAA